MIELLKPLNKHSKPSLVMLIPVTELLYINWLVTLHHNISPSIPIPKMYHQLMLTALHSIALTNQSWTDHVILKETWTVLQNMVSSIAVHHIHLQEVVAITWDQCMEAVTLDQLKISLKTTNTPVRLIHNTSALKNGCHKPMVSTITLAHLLL